MVNIRMMLAGEGKRGGEAGEGPAGLQSCQEGWVLSSRRERQCHQEGAAAPLSRACVLLRGQREHHAVAAKGPPGPRHTFCLPLPPVSRTQLQILKNRNSTRGASPKSQDIRRGEAYSVPKPLWLGFPLFRGRSLRSSLTLRPVPLGVTFGAPERAGRRPPRAPPSSSPPRQLRCTHGTA